MRISDWSSDVCSSDLCHGRCTAWCGHQAPNRADLGPPRRQHLARGIIERGNSQSPGACQCGRALRSEEHTSELQSLMRISYAVFCLKKKKNSNKKHTLISNHNTHYESLVRQYTQASQSE